jgi:Ca2+-binding RTX toxin-like protein
VSPDGDSVYVASRLSSSVSHFSLAPEGQITFQRCYANDSSQGCVDLPGEPLTGANGVAVSPDGDSVYVTSFGSNTVSHFFRARPGAAAGGAGGGGGGGGGGAGTAFSCGGKPATLIGTPGNDDLAGTTGPDVIVGLEGNDIVRGLGGPDVICGGPGRDNIYGGGGKDRLIGNRGRDRLFGGPRADNLNGGPGFDRCRGGPGGDRFRRCEVAIQ